MTDLHSVRWAVALGLAYVLLVLFVFALVTVRKAERNARDAARIVRAYPGR